MKLSSFIFILGLAMPFHLVMLVDVATFFDSPTTTSPREMLAVRRSG